MVKNQRPLLALFKEIFLCLLNCGISSVSDQWHFGTDPDPFVNVYIRDANKKLFFPIFLAYYYLKVHFNHYSKLKSHKEVTKQ
jgi:hypothetical protein